MVLAVPIGVIIKIIYEDLNYYLFWSGSVYNNNYEMSI
jgi:hypothetical protein